MLLHAKQHDVTDVCDTTSATTTATTTYAQHGDFLNSTQTQLQHTWQQPMQQMMQQPMQQISQPSMMQTQGQYTLPQMTSKQFQQPSVPTMQFSQPEAQMQPAALQQQVLQQPVQHIMQQPTPTAIHATTAVTGRSEPCADMGHAAIYPQPATTTTFIHSTRQYFHAPHNFHGTHGHDNQYSTTCSHSIDYPLHQHTNITVHAEQTKGS